MVNLNFRRLNIDIKSHYTASRVFTMVLVVASDETVHQPQSYHYFSSRDFLFEL